MHKVSIADEIREARDDFKRLVDEAATADRRKRNHATRWTNDLLLFPRLFGCRPPPKSKAGLARAVPELLLVCIHSAGGSQMTAALADSLSGGRVHVRTAESEPAGQINPQVIEVLAERGIDLTGAYPQSADRRPMSAHLPSGARPVTSSRCCFSHSAMIRGVVVDSAG